MKSGLFFILFLISLANLALSAAGFFDLSEYRYVSYDASIADNLLWFAPNIDIRQVSAENIDDIEREITEKLPAETEEKFMFVTSNGGQKFACSLPDVDVIKKSNAPKSSTNPKIFGELLAASFYVEKCIKMSGNHWWQYILCRGLTVEQIHGEPGKDGYVKNILGLFDGNLTMPPYSESTEDRLLYVEESYSAGTFCDLEDYKLPRKTSVRYECDPSLGTNEAYLQSVVETKPCQYLMIVKVGTLCSFPEFLPASQANIQKIECQPYMSKEEIRNLLLKQLNKQKRKEELEQELRDLSHEFKMATERYVAMFKSQRSVELESMRNTINAEMDFYAANFDLLALLLEKSGEKEKTKDLLTATWDILKTTDATDYLFYVDYDSIPDENRGHLWYYFHDPKWPKDQFPKDIFSTAIQNGYIEDVQYLMSNGYSTDEVDKAYLQSFITFVKTGVFDLDLNLAITAEDILEDIISNGTHLDQPKWMQLLYLAFLQKREKVYQKVVVSISSQKKNKSPFGGLAEQLIPDVLGEIEEKMKKLAEEGLSSGALDPMFESLDLKVKPKNVKEANGKGRKFELEMSKEKEVSMARLYRFYIDKIAPFYHMISIMYFQKVIPDYFHVWPPDKEHLYPEYETDEFVFHENLAKDAVDFARLLTLATLMKMTHVVSMQKGDKTINDFNFVNDLPVFEKNNEKLWEFSHELYTEMALSDVLDFSAEANAHESRVRIWKKRTEKYRMDFWMIDYKKRIEAKTMHTFMHSLLHSVDKLSTLHTVGGYSVKKKKKTLNEKDLVDILTKDEKDQAKLLLDRLYKEMLDDTTNNDKVLDGEEFGDMKEVFDLLNKAGLSKNVDVQIKVFDADGVEISNDELDAVKKELFEEVDSMNRFKATEKAYSTKVTDKSEEKK